MGIYDEILGTPAPEADAPVLRGSFDEILNSPVRAAGAGTYDHILNPPAPQAPAPRPALAPPSVLGYGDILTSAGSKGASEGVQEVGDFFGRAKAWMSGEPFFTSQTGVSQEPSDVDHLLKTDMAEGWTDPKWWTAQAVYGMTKSLPQMAVGVGGGVLGGPAGAGVGTGATEAAMRLLPAFRAAKEKGLSDDDAISEAAAVAAASGATFGIMGAAGMTPMFGTLPIVRSNGTIAQALKHPIKEALTQLGVIQPTIGAAGTIATGMAEGRDVSPMELFQGTALNTITMAPFTAAHIAGAVRGRGPRPAPTPEDLGRVFKQQIETPPLEGEVLPPLAEQGPPPVGPTFYSTVRRTVEEKGPNTATGDQWLATIKNAPGVKEEEVNFLQLPRWLGDAQGKISKQDLIAHIEEKQLRLEEVQLGGKSIGEADIQNRAKEFYIRDYGDRPPVPFETISPLRQANYLRDAQRSLTREHGTQYEEYTLPGPRERYGELLLKIPVPPPVTPEGVPVTDPTLTRAYRNLAQGREGVEQPYRAPHFTTEGGLEENLLAHARWTGRLDRDGKSTLVVEEIQSDWHQEGKKHGYVGGPEVATWTAREMQRGPGQFDNVWRVSDGTREYTATGVRDVESAIRQVRGDRGQVPDAPFKSNWAELVVKRMLRFAADEGFERIAWTNGDQQVARYGGLSTEQAKGMREFYDQILPRLMQKWGGKLGMQGGETRFVGREFGPSGTGQLGPRPNRYLDVSPASATRVRAGLPLFEMGPSRTTESPIATALVDKGLLAGTRQAIRAIEKLKAKMGLEGPLDFEIVYEPGSPERGAYGGPNQGRARPRVKINLGATDDGKPSFRSVERIYSTLAHEFGHYVFEEHFKKAPPETILAITAAYDSYNSKLGTDPKLVAIYEARNNAIREWYDSVGAATMLGSRSILSLTPEQRMYWRGFQEWQAEQVAKWMTTDAKPLGVVERYFSALANSIRQILKLAREKFGKPFNPEIEVKKWLDSFLKSEVEIGADKVAQIQLETLKRNQAALDREGSPEVKAVPQQASSSGGRALLNNAGAGDAGKAAAAHADRMNSFYWYAYSLPQLAAANVHIKALQLFHEVTRIANTIKNNIWDEGSIITKSWKHLSSAETYALSRFLDDYMNGRYLAPEDRKKNGIHRMPTPEEAMKLAKEHGLSARGLSQFEMIREYFLRSLERQREIALDNAKRLTDPAQQALAIEAINREFDAQKQKPYMPAMRWGEFTIEGKNAKGDQVQFFRYESLRQRKQALQELQKQYPDITWTPSYMSKDAQPMTGFSRNILNAINDKLTLSATQKKELDNLRFEWANDGSFLHRFQEKKLTPGYSMDWQRAFANYVFHEGNYISRLKTVDQLRSLISDVASAEERGKRVDPTKLVQIRNFMSEHLQMQIDPKADWAALRSIAFPWYLGYNVRAAAVNMTQVPLMSWPHLASKFGGLGVGDARAAAALMKAMGEYSTYWRRGTLRETDVKGLKGIREAVRDELLTESQGTMLAAIGEGRNLFKGFGHPGERAWQSFNEWGASMFQGTEQWNRVVTFKAAWDLALRHPDSIAIKEAIDKHGLKFQQLLDTGWTKQEAGAFVAAREAVEATNFVYSPYARPKMMQGKLGTLLVFKSFTSNMLFNSWNNKAAGARSLVVLAGTAGLSGLPFAEDIMSLIQGLAHRLFGKDFDLEKEVRKYVVDYAEGKISPDLVLHGVSRYGFGMPQVADMLGALVGVRSPIPSTDISGSLGMGRVLPVDVGKLITPKKDMAQAQVREAQQAAGAVYGLGFSLYNFATSSPFDDPDAKKWEQIMPTAIRNASQAFRWYREGEERNKLGNPILQFDTHDTQHMAEILAKGIGGFQPTRLQARYQNIAAKAEDVNYWNTRREVIMKQFSSAVKDRDEEKIADMRKALKNYNDQVPQGMEMLKITREQLLQSLQTRARTRALQELGMPTQKRNIGIYREIDRLYPEGAPDNLLGVKRVR